MRDAAMNLPLEDAIAANLALPAPGSVVALGEALRRRFGSHALAVLFYGSCRRANDDTNGIVDLYVLVDDYRAAYGRALPAFFNRILAPNVYYLETPVAGRTARAKCAVVSLAAFERGTARWFHSYLWGRFAQPCGLLYAADASVRARVVRAIGQAVDDVCGAGAARAAAGVRRRSAVDAGLAADVCSGTALRAAGAHSRVVCESPRPSFGGSRTRWLERRAGSSPLQGAIAIQVRRASAGRASAAGRCARYRASY